ncbi:MAG: type III pantothenate kinase [Janthinobacterium lividum]
MLLLIDAGNTRIKWAFAAANTASAGPRCGYTGNAMPAQPCWVAEGALPVEQVEQLNEAWRIAAIDRVLVSNVAGAALGQALQRQIALAARADLPPPVEWFASSPVRGGVRNGYRQPLQLGADRFAAAIGARALYGNAAMLVVMCGTATTIDALDTDGLFEGGMILPGIDLMAGALARNTAQLPAIAVGASAALSTPFATDTGAAISSGCLAAQCGAIERAFRQFSARQPGAAPPLSCILAGGAAARIAPHLSIPHLLAGNLVLAGLFHVAMESPIPC